MMTTERFAWIRTPSSSTGRCCAAVRRARVRSGRRPSCSIASRSILRTGSARCCAEFDLAVDLGTPAGAVRDALAGSAAHRASDRRQHGPGRRCHRRRGGAAVPRRFARSRRLGAGVAHRQRSAGHAHPDTPRAQAGRTVHGRAARRRHADRVAPVLRAGRGRDRGRRLAACRAVRRCARDGCAAAARRFRAAGDRCGPDHRALFVAVRPDGASFAAWARPMC